MEKKNPFHDSTTIMDTKNHFQYVDITLKCALCPTFRARASLLLGGNPPPLSFPIVLRWIPRPCPPPNLGRVHNMFQSCKVVRRVDILLQATFALQQKQASVPNPFKSPSPHVCTSVASSCLPMRLSSAQSLCHFSQILLSVVKSVSTGRLPVSPGQGLCLSSGWPQHLRYAVRYTVGMTTLLNESRASSMAKTCSLTRTECCLPRGNDLVTFTLEGSGHKYSHCTEQFTLANMCIFP